MENLNRSNMKTIWKYKIDGSIQMPMDAQILTVQNQNGEEHLWALVNPNNELETRKFLIVGTGQSFDDTDTKYIGTFQQPPFVWHLFELVH